MGPVCRTRNRAMGEGLGKRLRRANDTIACAPQGRINSQNCLGRARAGWHRWLQEQRGRPSRSHTLLHLPELLRGDPHSPRLTPNGEEENLKAVKHRSWRSAEFQSRFVIDFDDFANKMAISYSFL